MNTYELCKAIRNVYVIRAAEIFQYEWDAKFCKEQIKEIEKVIKNWKDYEDVQPSELTEEQMKDLNFCKWSKDTTAYLIPLYLLPFLPEKIHTTCINKKEYFLKSKMDNDHRFGCLAYMVEPKNKEK